ncbi:hypothetical protein K1719_038598 [Acacia pycnantha]|nr:hypothetical protein K1719_038598 [Acacia pycnantha]
MESHLEHVKRIFRYLADTKTLGLWFPKDQHEHLVAYTDSDHAGYKADEKAQVVNDVKVMFIPTHLQLADIFTKPLAKEQFVFIRRELGMVNPNELMYIEIKIPNNRVQVKLSQTRAYQRQTRARKNQRRNATIRSPNSSLLVNGLEFARDREKLISEILTDSSLLVNELEFARDREQLISEFLTDSSLLVNGLEFAGDREQLISEILTDSSLLVNRLEFEGNREQSTSENQTDSSL